MASSKPTKEPQTSLRGRDAGSGRFIPVEQARRQHDTAIVQRIPLPGKGKGK